MVHHGKNIERIAAQKGFKKSHLARLLNKSHQAVGYDLGRTSLNSDVLESYAKILQVNAKDFQKEVNEETPVVSNNLLTVEKMMELMEENRKLWSVIARHGISVNFNSGVPVSVFGRIKNTIFFDKRIQKRTHPQTI